MEEGSAGLQSETPGGQGDVEWDSGEQLGQGMMSAAWRVAAQG